MSLFLGIDFGTTGVRSSIIDKNKKELINFSVSIDSPISKGSLAVSYTHLTLPTRDEV